MKIFGITADSPVGEQRAALEELIDHGHSIFPVRPDKKPFVCLLYTSDAADE